MLEKLIAYFVNKHLLTNLLFVSVILAGIFSWQQIKKEEMPDVTYDWIRIGVTYPGATASEVEHFVTQEIEKSLQGIDGIYSVNSTASRGSSSTGVQLEKNLRNKDEIINEIRNAVIETQLPPEVRDTPSIRVYKTSKKAIIDLAIINRNTHLLDTEQRIELQQLATALEYRLMDLPQINSVNRSGYFQQEIQIKLDPQKLIEFSIPVSQVISEIKNNHIRRPAGHIEAKNEPNVTVSAELDTIEKLKPLYIQAGFEGKAISLQQVADVGFGFKRDKQITKVNGHEAVFFNVVKNSSSGILEALESVKNLVEKFKQNNLSNTQFDIVLLDDESYDVRNRLRIIALNGAIGFALILITLFVFLNRRSGFWVAMGIPFTIFLTLCLGLFFGYTINNITLAAVIIVMGIVVDDAIVVAENISRFRLMGHSSYDAAVNGTKQVFLPVVASVVTTCIAFIPLYFFSGRFGYLNSFIPPIVFLMLLASLVESLIILPGHMHFKSSNQVEHKAHWFDKVEHVYAGALAHFLKFKYLVIIFSLLLFSSALYIANSEFKFVLFPQSETREIVIFGNAAKTADRFETANLSRQIEKYLTAFIGKEIVGIRTEISRSRRGGAVEENYFRMIVEIVPKEDRELSADDLVEQWKPTIKNLPGLRKVRIRKSRWGHSSGSAIEVVIRENSNKLRKNAAEKILKALQDHPDLTSAEIEEPIKLQEYKIDINRNKVKRLAINPQDISSTFRAALEGEILYELIEGNTQIDVRLSIQDQAKNNIDNILKLPVENRSRYLAPMSNLVSVELGKTPSSIARRDGKRVTKVYADLKKENITTTPLDIADYLENGVFKQIERSQASTSLDFDGEIYDTRESKSDFRNAIIMVALLIFAILAILFNSLWRSIVIMLAIPFGIVGVIYAFLLHGNTLFGFYASIGVIGMMGVVINDAIIMITKLDLEIGNRRPKIDEIVSVSKTRLKAVVLTTITTVAGVLPTAYGIAGYDAMLAEMMLALAWGLLFGSIITLIIIPCLYSIFINLIYGTGRNRVA